MKKISLYVITGFLSTGKTVVLNNLLIYRIGNKPAIIQFEQGITKIDKPYPILSLSPFDDLHKLESEISNFIHQYSPKEIWIEWNGMVNFTILERIFLNSSLQKYFILKQNIFVSTIDFATHRLGKTGNAILSQLHNADTSVLITNKEVSSQCDQLNFNNAVTDLQQLNKHLPVYSSSQISEKNTQILKRKNRNLLSVFSIIIFFFIIMELVYQTLPSNQAFYLQRIITLTTGIFFQALPFILLGSVVSSLLQLIISPRHIEYLLGNHNWKAFFSALLGGFLLPICDCATLPIFKSLLLRKVPLSNALLFTLSSPIINPVVILSSYYAFAHIPWIGILRVILGLLLAVLISFSFYKYELPVSALQNSKLRVPEFPSCADESQATKLNYFLIYVQIEFNRMTPYLLLGSFLASLSQIYLTDILKDFHTADHMIISIIVMMLISFLLSLCSTADSMIARNFLTQFPLPSILGFLLIGPILDFKNFLLLKSLFPPTFVYRLSLTIVTATLMVTILFSYIYGGLNYVKI